MPAGNRLLLSGLLWLCLVHPGTGAELPPLTTSLTAIEPVAAPALALQNLDGDLVDLAGLAGQVVVINFWATWCPPCRREMPSLERMRRAAGDGIHVLAVNVGEDFETIFAFLGSVEPAPEFPVLMDTTGDIVAAWGVSGLPTTYVVDASGRLVYRAVGGREFDHPDIVSALRALESSN